MQGIQLILNLKFKIFLVAILKLKKKSLLPWRIAYLNAPSNKKNFIYLNLLLTFLSVGQEMFISQLLSLGQPPTGVSNGK